MTELEWRRLWGEADKRFRLQRVALVEYARAILPTRYSRRVVDLNAMPAEIWECGNDFGFVWQVRHEDSPAGTAARRILGCIRHSPGQGLQVLPFNVVQALPDVWNDVERIDLADQFWRSDQHPPAPPTVAAGGPADAPTESGDSGPDAEQAQPPSSVERIDRARRAIDEAFARFLKTETSLPVLGSDTQPGSYQPRASRWRPQRDPKTCHLVAALLERAQVCNFRFDAASDRMMLLERDVPFYRGCRLFRVSDMRGPRSRFTSFVLHLESADIACLSTQSPAIHAFNIRRANKGELVIDGATAGAYARFFCEFVQGQAGAFSIIEQSDEIRWLSQRSPGLHVQAKSTSDEPDAAEMRVAINDAIEAVAFYRPRFEPSPAQPEVPDSAAAGEEAVPLVTPLSIYCRALLGYGRHLFIAGLAVRPDGRIDMFADSPLHSAPLPIQPLSFNSESQFELRVDHVRSEGMLHG